jgi:hypothetical protein
MLTIVIPTYWKRKDSLPGKPEDLVFDHPTALDGEDTLTRTLDSLKEIKDDFTVVVITATVNHEIDEDVEKRVARIIRPFRQSYRIMQFAESNLCFIRSRMSELSLRPEDISLEGYSSIRNCQLLIPSILGTEIISAIDDDEIVEPDFVRQAGTYVGKQLDGKTADGIGGRYFYEWGNYRVIEPKGARDTLNVFGRKHALQNDSYELFDSREGRVVETSIVLGGNMVFSKKLFQAVPFDPFVTRGEDIDYLINSRIMGYNWMLDKELKIYHYPPACNPSHKLQEDIIRFIYEKRKIELSEELDGFNKVSVEELKPYPGEYFTERLEEDALSSLTERDGLSGDEPFYLSPEATIEAAHHRAELAPEYYKFISRWQELVKKLSADTQSVEYLKDCFNK